MTLILGIDEAGRGPIIGPLVIAGVKIEEELESKLKSIGVKDSKLLTPAKRESLALKIQKLAAEIKVIKIFPAEIDSLLNSGTNLNYVEAMKIAEIIEALQPEKAFIDSPTSPLPETFSSHINKYFKATPITEIICAHKAESKFPCVAAASIIAKTTRDEEVQKIKDELGIDFGSGYPADPITKAFLKNHVAEALHHIRTTWTTYKSLNQRTLSDF